MPTPLNLPTPVVTSGGTIAAGSETVIATSAGLIVDTPQSKVVLRALVDLTIGTNGVGVTLKLKRGTTTGGTAITAGETWGPYVVVATHEYQFSASGYDIPGLCHGQQYVLTATIASGSATTTINNVVLEAFVSAST